VTRGALAARVADTFLSQQFSRQTAAPAALSPAPERYLELVAENPDPVTPEEPNATPVANRGMILLGAGHIDEAVETCRLGVRLDPQNAYAQISYGAALAEAGDLEGALEAYDTVLELDRANPRVQFYRGIALAELGRLDEAIEAYDRALSSAPRDAEARINRGLALARRGDFDQAIDDLSVGEDDIDALIARGLTLVNAGRVEEAIDVCRRAVDLDRANANLQLVYGFVLDEARHYDEATAAFTEAINHEPRRLPAYIMRGNALAKAGRLQDAIESYNEAAEIDRISGDPHFFRGIALDQAGLREDAIEAYAQASRLDPSNADAHFFHGLALADLDRPEEAIVAFAEASRLDPGNADAHYQRGLAFEKLGRRDDAIAAYNQAGELDPLNAPIHFRRGVALAEANRLEEAIDAFARAIDRTPQGVRPLTEIDQLTAYTFFLPAVRLFVQTAQDLQNIGKAFDCYRLIYREAEAGNDNNLRIVRAVGIEFRTITRRILAHIKNSPIYSEMGKTSRGIRLVIDTLAGLDIPPEEWPDTLTAVIQELSGRKRPEPRPEAEIIPDKEPRPLPEKAPYLYSQRAKYADRPDLANLDVVQFLRTVWGPWLATMTRRELHARDSSAYRALYRWLSDPRNKLPDDIPLPTKETEITRRLEIAGAGESVNPYTKAVREAEPETRQRMRLHDVVRKRARTRRDP
jgi:tetratricopeptide (TPR) repeat protein